VTLETQPTRNVLTGVPEYDAASESFSDVRALSAALRFLGKEADLATVMAVSGEAFRSVAHVEHWSIASAYVSREAVLAAGARAFGYQPRYLIGASADETWLAIRDAVDAGQPALSSGILTRNGAPLSTWWFLVRGYDAQERTVQVAGLPTGDEAFAPLPALHGRAATWTGAVKGLGLAPALWAERPIFLLGLNGQPPDPRTLALETIRRAMQMAGNHTVTVRSEIPYAEGRYALGLNSFEVWADRLKAITGRERFLDNAPEDEAGPAAAVARANGECAERVRCGRRAAAKYLKGVSDLFEGAAHDALISAAAGYTEVADLAEDYLHLFCGPRALEEQDPLIDRDKRRQGVLLLREMQALEGAAVAQLEGALKQAGEV